MSRKIDFGARDWSAHAQDHWLYMAANPSSSDCLRIVFVAYGRHAANGHARLAQGELAHLLVRKDGTLPDRRTVRRAIDAAVNFGYLLPESRVLCLVVSAEHVQGGIGDPTRRCDRDHTVRAGRTQQKDNTPRSPLTRKDNTRAGRFDQKDNTPRSRFVLSPSLSSVPTTPQPKAAS